MKAPTAQDYLARVSLLRLLVVLGLVFAPHFVRMHWWEAAFTLGVGMWRAAAALRQWPLPPTWIKVVLTIAAFAGVYASYGRISGQTAGVALLVLMGALKLTEMRSRRDVMVMVFLMYFVLVTHFLFSQELWTVAWLMACALCITALLIESNHVGEPLSPRVSLRLSGRMLAEALPLMALMFILFPRIPGPIWGLPSDAGAARSGLSDSMSPGDIASLIESNEVAFRVNFSERVPPQREMYWRGPVFDFFDGRGWKASIHGERTPAPGIELLGGRTQYEVVLEPNRRSWLFALDVADPATLPPRSRMHGSGLVLSHTQVKDRLSYQMVSFTRYQLQPQLDEWTREATLQLPFSGNDRARQLAQSWRTEGLDDAAIVQRALAMYNQEKFFYTLQPPIMRAGDTVDQFLFETRRGFCEHYASSFTFLMRAAKVPARVVTGYQGGALNDIGFYYVVRQSDAHAWTEVWLEGEGWRRVDPTAAVAPSRIERGVTRALEESGGLPDSMASRSIRWRYALEARWDYVNATWNEWVLAYGPQLQMEFLSRFGLSDLRSMILALTIISTLFMAAAGLILLRQTRVATQSDAALKLWIRAQRRLEALGLKQGSSEGPQDFIERGIRKRPDLAERLTRLRDAYLRMRYLEDPRPALKNELEAAVKAL
jgi:transglutaminase-like putative cysteine protease